jgi:hypothetical protein
MMRAGPSVLAGFMLDPDILKLKINKFKKISFCFEVFAVFENLSVSVS